MALQNAWVGYVSRTYQQIKADVLAKMYTLCPEITDHTESNPFVKMLSIWAGIAEMLGYYIDNAARESMLATCRLYWTAVRIARSTDYRVKARIAATGEVIFTLSGPAVGIVSIPANTEVKGTNNLSYFTTVGASIGIGETSVIVPVMQRSSVVSTFSTVSVGGPSQRHELPLDIADGLCSVSVAAVLWNGKETLAYSLVGDQDVVQTVNTAKVPVIEFGDGVSGVEPTIGDAIDVDYYTTSGADGNLEVGGIDTIVSPIVVGGGLSISVTNSERISNGDDIESLQQLKSRVPKFSRTNDRAVTEDDYKGLAETVGGVAKAGIYFGCGKRIKIYIVPVGGGIASPVLLNNVLAFMETKKMITTLLSTLSAGEVQLVLEININVSPTAVQAATVVAVQDAILAYLSTDNQEIGGEAQLSDIYEAIETTEGVENSLIVVMRPVPYARIIAGVTTLAWTRLLKVGSVAVIRWEINMVSTTTFEVIRENIYMGTFAINVLLSFAEIDFTVTGVSYPIGSRWEFYSYPFFGTVQLSEPSMLVSNNALITINATGGL